jgi:transcription initiation factor TFIID subunit 1
MFEAFPDQSETAIRAKLKDVASFQRSGAESGWWTPRLDQPVPRGSELHEMVTPEALCAYESMQAGKYHLSDIGLEVLTVSPQLASVITKMKNENPLKRTALVIDQELRLSPWNLSENFLTASKGRCLLRLKGPGNPLGRGQALCYMRAPTRGRSTRPRRNVMMLKAVATADPDPVEKKIGPMTALTGTNKDLRKLHMNELRDVLLSFGVPAEHIEKLLRWERVRLVREKVSEATRQGEETQYGRFARANRNTYRSLNKQFLKDAQRILERQCEVLASEFVEEDEEHSNTDEEMDEWAKDLENMLDEDEEDGKSKPKKKANDEDDRREFERFMREQRRAQSSLNEDEGVGADAGDDGEERNGPAKAPQTEESSKARRKVLKKVLKKTVRTMQPDGSEVTKVTILSDSALVKAFELDQADGGGRLHQLMKEKSVTDLMKRKRKLVGDKKRRRHGKNSDATRARRGIAAAGARFARFPMTMLC